MTTVKEAGLKALGMKTTFPCRLAKCKHPAFFTSVGRDKHENSCNAASKKNKRTAQVMLADAFEGTAVSSTRTACNKSTLWPPPEIELTFTSSHGLTVDENLAVNEVSSTCPIAHRLRNLQSGFVITKINGECATKECLEAAKPSAARPLKLSVQRAPPTPLKNGSSRVTERKKKYTKTPEQKEFLQECFDKSPRMREFEACEEMQRRFPNARHWMSEKMIKSDFSGKAAKRKRGIVLKTDEGSESSESEDGSDSEVSSSEEESE